MERKKGQVAELMTWTLPPRTLEDFDRLFAPDKGRTLGELLGRVVWQIEQSTRGNNEKT